MSNTLLSYVIRTTPDPLQVSPQTGSPSPATLTIVVSNDTPQMIGCKSTSFGFLQGTNARDFFSDSTGIAAYAPTGWSLHRQGSLFTARPDTENETRPVNVYVYYLIYGGVPQSQSQQSGPTG